MAHRGHPEEVAWPAGGRALAHSPAAGGKLNSPKCGIRFDTAHQAMAAALAKGNRQAQLLVTETHSIASVIAGNRREVRAWAPQVASARPETYCTYFGWKAVLRSGAKPHAKPHAWQGWGASRPHVSRRSLENN